MSEVATRSNKKHLDIRDLAPLKKLSQEQNKKLVFTYGTFDLIHSGHALYLLKAKQAGDILVVGVAHNKSNRSMRGKGFPLIDQKNRAELLQYFDFVDHTVYINKQNLLPILRALKPDVFYTLGQDWKSHLRKPAEEKLIKKYKGRILKEKAAKPFVSAAEIVNGVADLKIKEIVEYFFGKIEIDLKKGNWAKNKFSGIKTSIRDESLYFGEHSKDLNLFSRKYYAELIKRGDIKKLGEKLRKDGKKIVLSSGACDLLHAGHARFYNRARNLGDVLVLALPSDKIIRKQKGRGRPIINEKSRAELMGFFGFVDYIVIFDDESVTPILKELKPDIFFTVDEGWNKIDEDSELNSVKDWGGKIVMVPPQSPNLSSSKLIRKAAGIRVRQLFKEVLSEAEKFTALKD
jgi:rfaE bifunctional protein nucleotidyltransferase chain/domain